MTTPVLDPETTLPGVVRAFAAGVRSALADLDPEERDELTDGLEAELLDRVAESGDDALGDPNAYAAELRQAAGLPPRQAPRVDLPAALRAAWRSLRGGGRAWLARHPAIAAAADVLESLRPVWWVLRAVVAAQLLLFFFGGGAALLPIDGGRVLLVVVLAVLSVQFGRGRWLPREWMRGIAAVAHVILIVAALPVAAATIATVNSQYSLAQTYLDQQYGEPFTMYPYGGGEFATTVDGTTIENVFVYDAHGEQVPDAQLYDQNGDPIDLVGSRDATFVYLPDGTGVLVPSDATPGRAGWNIYPLARTATTLNGVPTPNGVRHQPAFPFDRVPALVGAEAPTADDTAGRATDGATVGPAPDATP